MGETFGSVYEQMYYAKRRETLVEGVTEYTAGKFGEPEREYRARVVVAITTRLTNSPELNNNPLKEGLLERGLVKLKTLTDQ